MEIIIDEFHYPKTRSISSRIRVFLKFLKEKSHFLALLLVFLLISRRFSHRLRSFLTKTPATPQKKSPILEASFFSAQFLEKVLLSPETLDFVRRYLRETQEMYAFDELQANLQRNDGVFDQKTALFERFRLEIASFACVSAFCKQIFPVLAVVQALLQRKYLDKFAKKYGNTVISEAENMMTYIIREFFDGLLRNGVKNLVQHTKVAISLRNLKEKYQLNCESQENREDFKEIPGNRAEFKGIQGNREDFKGIPGNPDEFNEIPGNPGEFKEIQGNPDEFKGNPEDFQGNARDFQEISQQTLIKPQEDQRSSLQLPQFPDKPSPKLYSSRFCLDFLDELLAISLAIGSKNLNLPDDNKRWRCFSLSNFQTFQRETSKSLHFSQKKLTFTDFNVVSTEIHEIEDEDQEVKGEPRAFAQKSAFFPRRGLTVPKNTLDFLNIFNGDIANHRYFLDQDFIEKYIVTADHKARAERFRCELQEIREETEDSESVFSEKSEGKAQLRSSSGESQENQQESEDEDEEKRGENVEEARYYFALILKLLCGEIVDFLESSNLNIYMYYAVKYEFLCLKSQVSQEKGEKTPENWLDFLGNCVKSEEIPYENEGKTTDFLGNHAKSTGNRRKIAILRKLLAKSRTQIVQTLVLSEEEYQLLEKTPENREIPMNSRTKVEKMLELLMNFGSSQENE